MQRHEATAAATKHVQANYASALTDHGVAILYLVSADIATRLKKHEVALRWARESVRIEATAESKLQLVVALVNAGQREEAQAFIDTTLAKGGVEAEEFKKRLAGIRPSGEPSIDKR